MSRTQISIKLDTALLERVDALAEATGQNRTAVIEMAIKNDLPEQEAFQKSMENPVMREVHKQLTRPGVLKLIASLANEPLSEQQLKEVLERAPRQRKAGKRRQEAKKSSSKPNPEAT
ncbi:MAG: ribbon-helix-helix protein, CopG family [Phycisphaeraceae bacterium]